MFLSEKSVITWLTRYTRGELKKGEHAPSWMKPLLQNETQASDLLALADGAVESSRIIARSGREGLRFTAQLNDLVDNAQQLAAAIEEMSASAHEIEGYAQTVLQSAEQSLQQTDQGYATLHQLMDKLETIEKSVNQVGTHAGEFVEKTNKIISLTSTVNEISDQTNLLALNAAIEAARAGEHGRGFSVVADEVRGLAHRSSEAAHEIENIVSDVVQGANDIDTIIENAIQALQQSHEDRTALESTLDSARAGANQNVDAATQAASAASQQATVSQDMSSRIHSTSDAVNLAADSYRNITHAFSELREQQYRILGSFNADSAGMLLRLAKSDHVVWVDKVIRFALFGERNLGENELTDHTQCRLGKFLQSTEGEALIALPRYRELCDTVHPQVHKRGKAIYHARAQGREATELETDVSKLLQESDTVIEILDSFIRNLNV